MKIDTTQRGAGIWSSNIQRIGSKLVPEYKPEHLVILNEPKKKFKSQRTKKLIQDEESFQSIKKQKNRKLREERGEHRRQDRGGKKAKNTQKGHDKVTKTIIEDATDEKGKVIPKFKKLRKGTGKFNKVRVPYLTPNKRKEKLKQEGILGSIDQTETKKIVEENLETSEKIKTINRTEKQIKNRKIYQKKVEDTISKSKVQKTIDQIERQASNTKFWKKFADSFSKMNTRFGAWAVANPAKVNLYAKLVGTVAIIGAGVMAIKLIKKHHNEQSELEEYKRYHSEERQKQIQDRYLQKKQQNLQNTTIMIGKDNLALKANYNAQRSKSFAK